MSDLNNGAIAPTTIPVEASKIVTTEAWRTNIYHSFWNGHEYVFMRNNGELIEFNKPNEWMPFVNEGKPELVQMLRENGYQDKLTKLLAEHNYDGMWDVLNSRRQGGNAGNVTEEEAIERGKQVIARNEVSKINSYTDDDKQFIYRWKVSLNPTNEVIGKAFGASSASVGNWIEAIAYPNGRPKS